MKWAKRQIKLFSNTWRAHLEPLLHSSFTTVSTALLITTYQENKNMNCDHDGAFLHPTLLL